ncbi:MAG: universal stress protein [Candidatus Loosdrechtia sp.]|uniref:universal stress protein n=1 Tax=Candidatus Loosdrechtia sp. TaxID=3101272 RepID=UPI003A6CA58A|nr:MAG: universal stress protein [Candidatus Jettenia sp. AMX2]
MLKIEKILFPTDFSSYAKHALKYALDFAVDHGAKLYIIHVIPKLNLLAGPGGTSYPLSELYNEIESESLKQLGHMVPKRFLEKITVENIVVRGVPFVEIAKAAKKHDIDLIIIATHGRTGLSHALIGSTAEKVVRNAPCPVLCVKHPEHEFVLP